MSRRPGSSPLQASGEAVLRVLELRERHPRWGPKKLHRVLERDDEEPPSIRTISRILKRAGKSRKRRAKVPNRAPTKAPKIEIQGANDLWSVDFKGWWSSKDGARCEPLTVRDAHSRFVLAAKLMTQSDADAVKVEFEELFERYGLPVSILVDNRPPFASTRSRHGLTVLSSWWVSMGIVVHRSRPGHLQDNGGHERMHLDMRFDVEDRPAKTRQGQQVKIDEWRQNFNHVRPHEALEMRTPSELYIRSPRLFRGSREPCLLPGHLRRA